MKVDRSTLDRPQRVVFFGTPDFAVPTLEALAATPDLRPALVVSQPSRRAGRGRKLVDPPVVETARRLGYGEAEIVQVQSVRDPEFLARLDALAPDIAVVVAFGQIFRKRLLELPRLGCVNLHASLLPRWRGAAPIRTAIAAGDTTTGVTTMVMERGLDSGPMLLDIETPIDPDETAVELTARLAALGGPLMVDTLRALARGAIDPAPQTGEPTFAPQLTKADGEVDWSASARAIYDRWRGFQPWPGLAARLDGRPLKLVRVALPPRPDAREAMREEVPGTVVSAAVGAGAGGDTSVLEVVCGDGRVVRLELVQRAGKRAVDGADLLRGERLEPPIRFDPGPGASGGPESGDGSA